MNLILLLSNNIVYLYFLFLSTQQVLTKQENKAIIIKNEYKGYDEEGLI